MIKAMFAFGALTLAVAAPAAAQTALPKCSATVRDSCDQSTTTEKNAMSAEQAMKSGGVGDRATSKAMPAKPMMHKKHHKMAMKTTTTATTTETPK